MTPHEEYIPHFEYETRNAEQLLACADGPPSPSKFQRAVLLLLRAHWANPANLQPAHSHLSCYVWEPGDKTTLRVEQAFNETEPDSFPGIFVKFGGLKLSPQSIANDAGESYDGAMRVFQREAVLSLSIAHTAASVYDAIDMADSSLAMLASLVNPLLMNCGAMGTLLDGFNEPRDEKPKPKNYYTVAIPLSVVYNHAVAQHTESHRIRQIISMVSPTSTQP